jgi:hypothetical protein
VLDRRALTGSPDPSAAASAARDEAQRLAGLNSAGNQPLSLERNAANLASGDIVIGYLANPSDLSSSLVPNTTVYNSVFVRLRRDSTSNGSLPLFFAPLFGHSSQDLTASATATYETGIKGFSTAYSGTQNSKLLPFALDVTTWTTAISGFGPDSWSYDPITDEYTPGGDSIREVKLYPSSTGAPGNFGTVDLGEANNSTSELVRQIRNGLNESDFAAMGGKLELNELGYVDLQGDTGLSLGFRSALEDIRGQPRIIPLYQAPVTGNGNNARFRIVGFAGVVILDVQLTGPRKALTIQPEFVTDATAYGGATSSVTSFVYRPLRLTR